MQLLDWVLVSIPLITILVICLYTRRYMQSVSDFLSGGRFAGRYLLAVSRGEMAAGAVVFVVAFDVMVNAGCPMWVW